MGAVCDWSIPSPGKPFFSHRHVQSVDKRHHPTDSLINCEMYSYLPLSYSRAPKTPPLLLFYPSVKGRNKLDSTRIFLLRKKKKKKKKMLSLQISRFEIIIFFHSHPTYTLPCEHACPPHTETHSVFKHRNARTQGQRERSRLCNWFKVVQLRHFVVRTQTHVQCISLPGSGSQITTLFWL